MVPKPRAFTLGLRPLVQGNFTPRSGEGLLAHTGVHLNFMLVKQPVCGLSNLYCTSTLITNGKGCVDQK